MLNVISNNNDLTQITKLGFSQVGLNAEENQLILSAAPKDQFIRATAEYQLCLDRLEDIDESLRPTTKTYMQGPFVLSMYNLGDDLSKSMLVFDIELQDPKKQESGIIIDDPLDWTSKSLAVFPFVDLFRKEIESEADRLSDFLKKHKNVEKVIYPNLRLSLELQTCTGKKERLEPLITRRIQTLLKQIAHRQNCASAGTSALE